MVLSNWLTYVTHIITCGLVKLRIPDLAALHGAWDSAFLKGSLLLLLILGPVHLEQQGQVLPNPASDLNYNRRMKNKYQVSLAAHHQCCGLVGLDEPVWACL